jgi:hypothetical protein
MTMAMGTGLRSFTLLMPCSAYSVRAGVLATSRVGRDWTLGCVAGTNLIRAMMPGWGGPEAPDQPSLN